MMSNDSTSVPELHPGPQGQYAFKQNLYISRNVQILENFIGLLVDWRISNTSGHLREPSLGIRNDV